MLLHAPLRKHPRLGVLLPMAAVYFGVQSFFNHKETIYLAHTFPCYAACLATVAWWFWNKRLLPRWAIAACLTALLALQTGGHVLRAWQDPYGRAHRPASEFVNRCAPEGAVIYGTAAMAYDIGFGGRLIDDPYLGLRTGKAADFVVVEELYRDLWGAIGKRNPAAYRSIQATLTANYSPLHRHAAYDIYIRHGVSCKAAP
jgi:hypothetical protein